MESVMWISHPERAQGQLRCCSLSWLRRVATFYYRYHWGRAFKILFAVLFWQPFGGDWMNLGKELIGRAGMHKSNDTYQKSSCFSVIYILFLLCATLGTCLTWTRV